MRIFLLCIIFSLICFISLKYYLNISPKIRVVNLTTKSEKIIYEGSHKNIKVIYESLKTDCDVVRIILFNKEKNQVSNRLFYRENIKVIYY